MPPPNLPRPGQRPTVAGRRPAPVAPPPVRGPVTPPPPVPPPVVPPGAPAGFPPPGFPPPPSRPPGVPVTPPPVVLPSMPGMPSPGGRPPTYPSGHVADRRTHAPMPPATAASAPPWTDGWSHAPMPLASPPDVLGGWSHASMPLASPPDVLGAVADDAVAPPAWLDAGDELLSLDPSHVVPGSPAWDVWQHLFGTYLGTRNAGVSLSGEVFPETTAGDVRAASLVLSRELCRPRYDFADLAATRAAWRDALARVHTQCGAVPWAAPYPDNERFWLGDAQALAQRLAAADLRQGGVALDAAGALHLTGDHTDPLALWQDLRQFFVARRPVRRGVGHHTQGLRYPETTVRDVAQVAHVLTEASARVAPLVRVHPALRARHARAVCAWHDAVERVAREAAGQGLEDRYPANERFWLVDAKRLALHLSVLRDAARAPGGAS